MTVVGVELVAVDAVYLDRLAVEQYERSSAVFHALYPDFAESEVECAPVGNAVVVGQLDLHTVEVGEFVGPKSDVFDF